MTCRGYMLERYITPCLPPTPHERELLEILIEECAEVQQRATKMLRFGVREVQPGQPDDNRRRLGLEIGDLRYMIGEVLKAHLILSSDMYDGMNRKYLQLARYLQHKAS